MGEPSAKRPHRDSDHDIEMSSDSSKYTKSPRKHINQVVLGMGKTLPFTYSVGGPYAIYPRVERAVLRTELNEFFGQVYDHMSTNYYSTPIVPNPVIDRDDFILVGQYLLNGRIHHVFSAITGRRRDGFTRLPYAGQIPKPMCDIISCYGRTTIFNDLVTVRLLTRLSLIICLGNSDPLGSRS